MRFFLVAIISFFAFSTVSFAKEGCTTPEKKAVCKDDMVKEKVKWACDLVQKEGKDAVKKIKEMRFDCCGEPDYVWINTYDFDSGNNPKPKMIMHPIKPMLDGKDIADNKDPNGKYLFREFVSAVKTTPEGAWVDYQWTKFGEKDPTDKKSWVQKCKVGSTNDFWVVGSGTWK